MVMLDNKLCLISVVEFLRRSRVDRDTREGKVVVGTDLSKQKVGEVYSHIYLDNGETVKCSTNCPNIQVLI
jgi:hypothetical protein